LKPHLQVQQNGASIPQQWQLAVRCRIRLFLLALFAEKFAMLRLSLQDLLFQRHKILHNTDIINIFFKIVKSSSKLSSSLLFNEIDDMVPWV
jgi:hypothetical protein